MVLPFSERCSALRREGGDSPGVPWLGLGTLTAEGLGLTPRQASPVALVVKNQPANAGDVEMRARSLGREDPLEKEMATDSSILA